MKLNVKTNVEVLRKPEPFLKADGNGMYYTLMVLNDVDCGTLYIDKAIYDIAVIGKKLELSGVFTNGQNGSYIKWLSAKSI